jgi:hypothetical protein
MNDSTEGSRNICVQLREPELDALDTYVSVLFVSGEAQVRFLHSFLFS